MNLSEIHGRAWKFIAKYGPSAEPIDMFEAIARVAELNGYTFRDAMALIARGYRIRLRRMRKLHRLDVEAGEMVH